MGLFLYGSAAGLTWVNLSALSAASGAADYDPSSQASSISSDSTGSTVAVENSVSVDGIREGALWDFGTAASVLGWNNDGTQSIAIRGTIVTSPPDNKAYWQGIALIANATYATADGLGIAIKRGTTDNLIVKLGPTGDTPTVGAVTRIFTVFHPEQDGAAGGIGAQMPGGTQMTGGIETADYSAARIVLVAGCEDSSDDGPHSAKVLWEAAVIDWSS